MEKATPVRGREHLISSYRSHLCSELQSENIGNTVKLAGWVMRKRDHGGVAFIDLRDHYGVTQLVFSGKQAESLSEVRVESVIRIEGVVAARSEGGINEDLPTGEIEVQVENYKLLSPAEVLPFTIAEADNSPEATRLKHRFLELRRERLHQNIIARAKITFAVREIMQDLGFLEYQTPILTSSSPEGARDYLVPSRVHPGKFFALPQAPQQFKQLLMVAGFDRYFQIAPCFRDEDARADRSPGEFYQIDLEMSFVEQEDVFRVNEELMHTLFTRFSDKKVTDKPFPRIPYNDALRDFGSDKPDLRNPLRIKEVSQIFKDTQFKVFSGVLEKGGGIFAISVPVAEIPSRKYFDALIDDFRKKSGEGLAYLTFSENEAKGSIRKFIGEEELTNLRDELSIDSQSIVLMAAGDTHYIRPWVGRLRDTLGKDFNLIEHDSFRFCWITDYPLYERDPETGAIDFSHNPFGLPRGGLKALQESDPLEIYSDQYDLVCNGYEFGSGAIRNADPEVMYKAFEIVGYGRDEVDEKFGGMIRAFKFGAPPHGGFAHGLDRIVMLLTGEETIREVMVFPMAQTAEDLLMGAPSSVRPEQLADVHVALNLPVSLEKKTG
jgi:aspartyl-tRNA synthetase